MEEGWPQNIYNITNLCTSTNEMKSISEMKKTIGKSHWQSEMVIVD